MPTINHFDYFTDIEQAFIKRRGKHLMIGPLDWALIDGWQKRGIPLRIVIQAIDEVFDSFEQRGENKATVRSLKYCKDAVERRFEDWSRAHVGRADSGDGAFEEDTGFSDAEIQLHIVNCLAALEVTDKLPLSVRDGFEDVKRELLSIQAVGGPETELDRLDEEIDALILSKKEALFETHLEKAIEAKIEKFGNARDAIASNKLICEAIREEYGIPRLSLYQL